MKNGCATSVRQVTRDQMELGPTGSGTGRSCFLLSPGCDRSRRYRAAHGTGLIPNETQFPCRTLVPCLVKNPPVVIQPRFIGPVGLGLATAPRGLPSTPTRRHGLSD